MDAPSAPENYLDDATGCGAMLSAFRRL